MPAVAALAPTTSIAAQGSAPAAAKSSTDDSGFTFDDFLDIINPLQHFPVISTLYRHFTGDQIGIPEKLAGDTLYGGLIGLAASVGDVLFQKITGRNVGDTVLALVTGDDEPATAVAATPASVTPANAVSAPDVTALTGSRQSNGVNADTAQRAIIAYHRAASCCEQLY